ncbi:MAG: hypothetical protein AAB403_01490, partial [Planctomycetota bacterium]
MRRSESDRRRSEGAFPKESFPSYRQSSPTTTGSYFSKSDVEISLRMEDSFAFVAAADFGERARFRSSIAASTATAIRSLGPHFPLVRLVPQPRFQRDLLVIVDLPANRVRR